MGTVYLALDLDLDRQVALKFLPAEYATNANALARFRREAKATASLKHPHVITIHEISSHLGKPFIVMECIDGMTLREVMARARMPVEPAVSLVIQACDGLARAHESNIIHRDIKPENLLVDDDNRLKIVDFGLARMRDVTTLTGTNVTLGTIQYMSPEQARGERVDGRSDIFSIGSVLYEMLVGAPPFRGERPEAILYQISAMDPPLPSRSNHNVTPELDRIVAKALAKEPSQRYQSATELAADLRRLTGDMAPLDEFRRKQRVAGLIVISALVATITLAVLLKPWRANFAPDDTATAADSRLAVMYFENVAEPADQERWAEIATNLLITDLAESEQTRVISSQRLYDIMRQKGYEGNKAIPRDIATEVAREAGAERMLVGAILRTKPQIEVTSQVIDIQSGESRATQRIRGVEGEDIFSIIDRLSAQLRTELGFQRTVDVAVADVTTRSVEAYRHYLEGRDELNRGRYDAARTSFEKAVAADTSFALAWIELTNELFGVRAGIPASEREAALAKATANLDRLNRKEQLHVKARSLEFQNNVVGAMTEWRRMAREFPDEKQAYYELGLLNSDPDSSIAFLRMAVGIDPLFKPAYSSLAEHYLLVGDTEKSFWAINQYINLAPDDATGYILQASVYGENGQIDRCISALKKVVALDPTNYEAYRLCETYSAVGNETMAESCWNDVLRGPPVVRAVARYRIATSRHYRGHVDEAIQVLEQATVANRLDGYDGRANSANHLYLSLLWAIKGDRKRADEEYENALSVTQKHDSWWQLFVVPYHIAIVARFDPLGAETLLPELAGLDPDGDLYWQARCEVEMRKKRYDRACQAIDKVNDQRSFHVCYRRGLAYLLAGRVEDSIRLLDRCVTIWTPEKAIQPEQAVQAHYYLGLAYEQTGQIDKAVEQFVRFTDLWGRADPVYADLVNDARRRLQHLRG